LRKEKIFEGIDKFTDDNRPNSKSGGIRQLRKDSFDKIYNKFQNYKTIGEYAKEIGFFEFNYDSASENPKETDPIKIIIHKKRNIIFYEHRSVYPSKNQSITHLVDYYETLSDKDPVRFLIFANAFEQCEEYSKKLLPSIKEYIIYSKNSKYDEYLTLNGIPTAEFLENKHEFIEDKIPDWFWNITINSYKKFQLYCENTDYYTKYLKTKEADAIKLNEIYFENINNYKNKILNYNNLVNIHNQYWKNPCESVRAAFSIATWNSKLSKQRAASSPSPTTEQFRIEQIENDRSHLKEISYFYKKYKPGPALKNEMNRCIAIYSKSMPGISKEALKELGPLNFK